MTVHFAGGSSVKPVDRKKTKPIYILTAEDPTVKGGIQLYRVHNLVESTSLVVITGHKLTSNQAKISRDNPDETQEKWVEVLISLPYSRVVRIDNIKYNK